MKKRVVIGITSGIAAYKILDLVRLFKSEDNDISVVMTRLAVKMVDIKAFEEEVGEENIHRELFDSEFDYRIILKKRKVDHIELADSAHVICIAPATANCIAKLAHGIADDFLTTMVLASHSPIILCPSMNVHMWTNPVTQENIEKLKKRGFIIVPPEKGPLACGYEGMGRLSHLERIKGEILEQAERSDSLSGKTILVTSGSTKEYIDDVRYVSNNSSGKMGTALSDECHLRGAKVILIRSEKSREPRYLYESIEFETAEHLETLLKTHVPRADVVIHVAAVGDFSVKKIQGKISSKTSPHISFSKQKKLSDIIKKINPNVFLVVFKAEWNVSEAELLKNAKEKLHDSSADVVIANDLSKKDRGFMSDTNEVILVTEKKNRKLHLASKQNIARGIIDSLRI